MQSGVKIVYDVDANRVQETVAGVSPNPDRRGQSYWLCSGAGELSGTNQMLRGYEWRLQPAAVRDFTVNPGGIFHYYGMDGHGSGHFLTISTGPVPPAPPLTRTITTLSATRSLSPKQHLTITSSPASTSILHWTSIKPGTVSRYFRRSYR